MEDTDTREEKNNSLKVGLIVTIVIGLNLLIPLILITLYISLNSIKIGAAALMSAFADSLGESFGVKDSDSEDDSEDYGASDDFGDYGSSDDFGDYELPDNLGDYELPENLGDYELPENFDDSMLYGNGLSSPDSEEQQVYF